MFKNAIAWGKQNKGKTMGLMLAMALIVSVSGYAYFQTFAAITLDTEISESATTYKTGVCVDGDIGHSCDGNVSVMLDNGSYFLYFEDYDATDVPDAYFYMTVEGNEENTEKIEDDGLLILTPQTDDGKAEVEGTFIIPLPEDYDPDAWAGLTVWCDAYDVVVGSASLQ
jgi:hypothetical protein